MVKIDLKYIVKLKLEKKHDIISYSSIYYYFIYFIFYILDILYKVLYINYLFIQKPSYRSYTVGVPCINY